MQRSHEVSKLYKEWLENLKAATFDIELLYKTKMNWKSKKKPKGLDWKKGPRYKDVMTKDDLFDALSLD
jgi:hypothetical protein